MRPMLFVTVGLPRSGKSTWARSKGWPIVSPDAIRMAIHGETFNPRSEHMVWTMAYYQVLSLFGAGHDRVVLDATNVTPDRRATWISRDWDTKFRQFVMIGADTCIARARSDGREDLIPIIERMRVDLIPISQQELEESARRIGIKAKINSYILGSERIWDICEDNNDEEQTDS